MAVALFDTNILIDCLKGYQPAIAEVEYWDSACISAITWMEVVAGAKDGDRSAILEFLDEFSVIHTDDMIMTFAADLRRTSIEIGQKLALPDAIIMTTGLLQAQVIITRNRRDFKLAELMQGQVRTPYELINTSPVGFTNILPPPAPPFVPRAVDTQKMLTALKGLRKSI
jgi:predicted nucleic acid-binding protein